ncbi:c2h2 transcription factor [Alternaria alternata]|nr:c2h2 transcription factor [Alternaria alternata]
MSSSQHLQKEEIKATATASHYTSYATPKPTHSHLKLRLTSRRSTSIISPLPHLYTPSPTAKLDSYEQPPPLSHSPRESTAASTPISTPVEQPSSPHFGRGKKDPSAGLSNLWHRKPQELVASHQPSEDVLFEDAGDCSFPLFPEEPQLHSGFADMATASPIDIQTPPRYGSNSPQNQTSNLTSALRQQAEAQPDNMSTTPGLLNPNNFDFTNGQRPSMSERHPSISMLGSSFYGNSGARPITMKDRGRRESTNMGSFAGGMSWGGHSVGSWIRDDIMMGTSPAPFVQGSPSFHSSSYLPKMEAAFMKDFTCCGLTLASLHDLLQHFEETHANAPAARPQQQQPQNGFTNTSGAPTSSIAPSQTQGDAYNTQNGFQSRSGSIGAPRQRIGSVSRSNLSTVQDMDTLDDMEMDDIDFNNLGPIEEQQNMQQFPVQNQFNQNQNQQPQLNVNVNLANNMQSHQGMRTSTPTTPSATQQFNLQNNPTVSSVNTPTMGTMPMQNHNLTSPESSHPGTPAELDMDFGGFNPMMGMDMNMNMGMNFGNGNGNFGMGAFDNNGTIDQPGKRLFSKQGGGLNQAQLQAALKNYQLSGNDQSEMARRLREQQLINGASIPQFPFPEEVKPFRCPVIGCEKAYKNQNGLKYHKQHGHQNQQLKENDDGTFSIVDPLTSIPYPGTVGMEKEKPYRCEVCGKRYKNLNGLKYHRSHAPHCNPELAMQKLGLTSNLQNLQNANVAGAGMGGIDPSMF